ncbi:cysteinyl-tRNA synthetase [Klebsormidium nitens]|uniref:cysteine--tRNA ligase n=1 Tax=Klebsormidium nitens TaxID=105231 RepID=A0A1Y1IDJ3_KLENI|nr:cysteinyl-tRNA synthetase [Klebsormidium nitens]|eukprot:GAQ86158.1 cysteinyl-tRNA synthetase [Klebsormidium nitens]
MTRQKEVFRPRVEGQVGMYVCGVTAYDFSHIGHARVYVWSDCLFRYLRHLGYEVKYVRNFTDVDDKIITRAKQTGEDPIALSERFCEEFKEDMNALRCLPPTSEPKVTTHIPQIITMIQQIINNGHAYAVAGDVYFTVDSFPEYGALSGRKQDENRAGERVAVDERKKNPADFALWKAAKEGEPSWESPWGRGRPGWHIECSAMSAEHLGEAFDIHGGGQDLVFPHHENELAQSRAACAHAHVGYWVHNGFVTVDEEKMSKSLGNFFTIRDVLKEFHPLALRWFLIGTQYRSPINYSRAQLDQASDRLYYLCQTVQDAHDLLTDSADTDGGAASAEASTSAAALRGGFEDSMSDDLNTPKAVAALSEPLKLMNDLMHTKKGRKDKARTANLRLLSKEVQSAAGILGFDLEDARKVLDELNAYALARARMTIEDLRARMDERAVARAAKDFARSDSIRAELAQVGIYLMDGGDGTLWKPAPVVESE